MPPYYKISMQTIANIHQLPDFINESATALAGTRQVHHNQSSTNDQLKNCEIFGKKRISTFMTPKSDA